jgi:hypothetical protein
MPRNAGINGPRPLHLAAALLALTCALSALVLLPAAARADGLQDSDLKGTELDLRLERTPVIREVSYRRLPPIGENGEMGANLDGGSFSVGHQQLGDLFVRAGIVRGKRRLIDRGLQAFDYAFFWQADDGSFPEDQAEAYAFFVEAVAHSIVLLRESRFADEYEDRLREYVPLLRRATRHMIQSDAWADFEYRNRFYTHSGYVMATALGLTAQLTGNGELRRRASRAIQIATNNQCCGGVNPELGGYDVRYQMAGLVWAERYHVYFPNARYSGRLERMIRRALDWMRPRVKRDGWIDWRGSTRTCREQNSNGSPKSPGYAYAIRAFAYWGRLTGSPWLTRKSNLMYDYLETHGDEGSFCSRRKRAGAGSAGAERDRGTLGGARLQDLYE